MTLENNKSYDNKKEQEKWALKREEKRKTERIVVDGNAFYELDLDCVERQKKKQESCNQRYKKKRQRK